MKSKKNVDLESMCECGHMMEEHEYPTKKKQCLDEACDCDEFIKSRRKYDKIDSLKHNADSNMYAKYAEVKKLNNTLKLQKKIFAIQEQNKKLNDELQVKIEEEKFYTEKDKDGKWILREDKYFGDLSKLYSQLEDAETDKEKKDIQNKIKKMEAIKKSIKIKNLMYHKIPKTSRKISEISGKISEGLGELSKLGNIGFDEKKHEDIGDMGFDPKKIFDKKFKF